MVRMVVHLKLPPDDQRHALGGPDLPTEAERLRPLRQQHGELRPLLRRQFRLGPGARPALQGRLSTLASTPHPLADGPSSDPQRLRNLLLAPPLRLQRPGAQPALFTPLLRSSCFLCHTTVHRTVRTGFSLLRGDQ
jgi:hypothetical protein